MIEFGIKALEERNHSISIEPRDKSVRLARRNIVSRFQHTSRAVVPIEKTWMKVPLAS